MKKIFNNSGVTLIEVIVAAIILAIIAVPVVSTLMQTFKINVSSDVDMRMKAEAERVIEEIKAAKGRTSVSAPNGANIDYSAGAYYDRLFSYVGTIPNDSRNYYELTADESTVNTIDTLSQYDRWDFQIGVQKPSSGLDSQVYVYKHSFDSYGNPIKLNSAQNGKVYATTQLIQGSANSMTIDLQGLLAAPYNFIIQGTNGADGTWPFTPGTGDINSGTENTIVVDLYRMDSSTGAPMLNVNVKNDTYYDGNTNKFCTTTDSNGNTIFAYNKNIIVNVFGDDPSNPNYPTIKVTPQSPYITINQIPAAPGAVPEVTNGNKINITIKDITVSPNKVVKVVSSVVK